MKESYEISSYDGFASHAYPLSGTYKVKTNSLAPMPLLKSPTEVRLPDFTETDGSQYATVAAKNRGCCVNHGGCLFHMDSDLWFSDNTVMAKQVLWTSQAEVEAHPFLSSSAALMEDAYFTTSVFSLPDGFARGCVNLTAVALPFNMTTVGVSAFAGCGKLRTLVVPGTVVDIKEGAFQNLPSECSVYFVKDVRSQIPQETQIRNLQKSFETLMTRSKAGFTAPSYVPADVARLMSAGPDVPEHEHHFDSKLSSEVKYGEWYGPDPDKYAVWSGGAEAKYDICWEGVSMFDLYQFAYDAAIGPLTLVANIALVTALLPAKFLLDGICSGILEVLQFSQDNLATDTWTVNSDGSVTYKGGASDILAKIDDMLGTLADAIEKQESEIGDFIESLKGNMMPPEQILQTVKQKLGKFGDCIPDSLVESCAEYALDTILDILENTVTAVLKLLENIARNPPISVRFDGISGNVSLLAFFRQDDMMCIHVRCDYPGCGESTEYFDYMKKNSEFSLAANHHDGEFSLSPWYAKIGEIVATVIPGVDGRPNALNPDDLEKITARGKAWIDEFVAKAKNKCIDDVNEQLERMAKKTQDKYAFIKENASWNKPCEHHEWTVEVEKLGK